MLKKKNTITDITFIGNRISDKTRIIISKDIPSIRLSELSHLLRESIAVQTSINISIERLKGVKFDFEFYFNNNSSEEYRELLRELILLDQRNWDLNHSAYLRLKKIISGHLFFLKLPEYILKSFDDYKPKRLEWNEKSIDTFNAYMNDTRAGVVSAYSMVHSLKQALLNGTKIHYSNIEGELEIDSLKEFESKILGSIKCNTELSSMLEKEKYQTLTPPTQN